VSASLVRAVARFPRGRRGAVLVLVLAVTALAAALAAEVAYATRVQGERARLELERVRAELLADAALAAALEILAADDRTLDHPGEPWATPFTLERPEGSADARVFDESARLPFHLLFDDHGLLNIGAKARFERLVEILKMPREVVDSVIDYSDPNSEPFPLGAEADAYAAMNPPRRPANRPLWTIEEFANVRSLDETSAARLGDFTTLLGDEKVNLNTAPPEVIAALSPAIAIDAAHRVVSRRSFTPLTKAGDIADAVSLSAGELSEVESVADVVSTRFRIVAAGRSGKTSVVVTTIVERQPGGFTVKYRLVS
jgi:general secretion pathway protein K